MHPIWTGIWTMHPIWTGIWFVNVTCWCGNWSFVGVGHKRCETKRGVGSSWERTWYFWLRLFELSWKVDWTSGKERNLHYCRLALRYILKGTLWRRGSDILFSRLWVTWPWVPIFCSGLTILSIWKLQAIWELWGANWWLDRFTDTSGVQ